MATAITTFACCVILALGACADQVQPSGLNKTALKVGYLVPMTGSWDIGTAMASAVPVALEEIEQRGLFAGFSVQMIWKDSGCSAGTGLAALSDLLNEGVDVLVGPACSVACQPTQMLAAAKNISQVRICFSRKYIYGFLNFFSRKPQISYGCTSGSLSDKATFPTFVRTVGPYSAIIPSIISVFGIFKWSRCGVVSSTQVLKSVIMFGSCSTSSVLVHMS